MGKTLMGSTEQIGQADLLSPQQQDFLGGVLGPQQQQQASQAYSQFLQPYSPEQYEDVFQKSVIDPSLKAYQQQIVPQIQQRFVDANASSSSALNQALARSAEDLGTSLGSQYGQFFQAHQNRQMEALKGVGALATQRTFEPIIQQRAGILGPLVGAAGQIGGMGAYGLLSRPPATPQVAGGR